MLAHVGKVLRGSLRPRDFVGRFGGDEFLVGLPDTTGKMALHVMDRLRRKVEESTRVMGNRVTFSGGTACLDCSGEGGSGARMEATKASEIVTERLATADNCLYAAKARGRDDVSAGPDMTLSEVLDCLSTRRVAA